MRKFRKPTLGSIVALLLMILGLGLMLGTIWQQEKNILEGEKAYARLQETMRQVTVTDTSAMNIEAHLEAIGQALVQMPVELAVIEQPTSEPEDGTKLLITPVGDKIAPLETETKPLVSKENNVDESKEPQPTEKPLTRFEKCKSINPDYVAWLSIPGTDIDYPVVRSNDVEHYLTHTFDGKKSVIGCPFSLEKTDYEKPSQNIAIYGHHLRSTRSQTMFCPLHYYKNKSYYTAHNKISLETKNETRWYEIFAVFNIRESEWDVSKADFVSEAEFESFLERAELRLFYFTGVPVDGDDHILTLITCDRDYDAEEGRLVVMAVQQ